ncbi:MAG: hypothetical protein N2441_06460 [Rhodocyclaceae bacterium]|nr:hypothetical protein [Rhodocyclaceae bacterium]
MVTLNVIRAAAFGLASLSAATECVASEVSPHACVKQQDIVDSASPACLATGPLHVTCAPQQTMNLPPHPPVKKHKTTTKVDVQVSCPERPPPATGGTGTTVIQTVSAQSCDKPPPRPEVIKSNKWITNLQISFSPSVSFSLTIALTFLLPFVAVAMDKRLRRRARMTK